MNFNPVLSFLAFVLMNDDAWDKRFCSKYCTFYINLLIFLKYLIIMSHFIKQLNSWVGDGNSLTGFVGILNQFLKERFCNPCLSQDLCKLFEVFSDLFLFEVITLIAQSKELSKILKNCNDWLTKKLIFENRKTL